MFAGAKFRKYVGHSSHVTNCRFSADKSRVITTGGADHAVFQWRFVGEGSTFDEDDLDTVDQQGFVDSNSEDSDSDMSDVGEVDSDIETEVAATYDRCVDSCFAPPSIFPRLNYSNMLQANLSRRRESFESENKGAAKQGREKNAGAL